ncbi:hypothetical protein NFX46_31595 [Streptomyces phaeoluteigriseus]|uniref:Spore-associated protein A n=1 Tax=Streptomyces phaeoluteigriseus TaxID=114686 RepID=A0ABY4ZFV5_9ACTN|nr:hypothetical protein [Streptomyces phaeoluteigriseus]USQ87876.1 hypothetical protein NFX46_31595 [Streptomyces phaeoluteigriseus]
MKRLLSTAFATIALAIGTVISTSSPAAAESAPGCGLVTQIGSTAYVKTSTGQTAASVKQFKGCGKNYAYVYVWDSFRDTHGSWKISAAIQTSSETLGTRSALNAGELWSGGTNTLTVCTQAVGAVVFGAESRSAATGSRC